MEKLDFLSTIVKFTADDLDTLRSLLEDFEELKELLQEQENELSMLTPEELRECEEAESEIIADYNNDDDINDYSDDEDEGGYDRLSNFEAAALDNPSLDDLLLEGVYPGNIEIIQRYIDNKESEIYELAKSVYKLS